MWWKLLIAIAVDGFDFTIGRFLSRSPTPANSSARLSRSSSSAGKASSIC
jgi:hypothetical protein